MFNLEHVDWTTISHQELDLMLSLKSESQQIDNELKDSFNYTPLCMACKYKREDLVTVLLYHGANTNKECRFHHCKQPLHFASSHGNGNLGIVRKLLHAGAYVDSKDNMGNTALLLACSGKNLPVAQLLIEFGADVNMAELFGETPLVRACMFQCTELIEILLKEGGDPNISEGLPLAVAVSSYSEESLKLLIEGGANINQRPYLTIACESDNIQMMKALNDYGIDVNRCDTKGFKPLHTACSNFASSVTCVHLLLEWGAEVEAKDRLGHTALYYACRVVNLGKIRALLAYGVNVNTFEMYFLTTTFLGDTTFLHVSKQCITIIKLLIAAGLRLYQQELVDFKENVSTTNSSKNEIKSLLVEHASHPLSLLSHCRIIIRSSMKSNVDVNIKTLPLPPRIIQFLNFDDIVSETVYLDNT